MGFLDIIGAYQEGEGAKDLAQANVEGGRQAQGLYSNAMNQLLGLYQPQQAMGAQGMANLNELVGEAFRQPTEQDRFNMQFDVNEYLDPSIAYQQDQARRQAEQSAVATGGLMSGGMAKQLQEQAMNIGQQGYQNAFNRGRAMTGDKYREYQDYLNNSNQQRQQRMGNLSSLIGQQIGQGNVGTQGMANAQQFGTQGMARGIGQEYQGIGERRASGNLQAGGMLRGAGDLENMGWEALGKTMGGM